MMHGDIRSFQNATESRFVAQVNSGAFHNTLKEGEIHAEISQTTADYWQFFLGLMAKYQNGYIVDKVKGEAEEHGYPIEWLRDTKEYGQFKASPADFDLLKKRMKDYQVVADAIVHKQGPRGTVLLGEEDHRVRGRVEWSGLGQGKAAEDEDGDEEMWM